MKIRTILNEISSDSDRGKIEGWILRHFEEISPEEIDQKVQDHLEEWENVKDLYDNSIESYFEEIETKGDFY